MKPALVIMDALEAHFTSFLETKNAEMLPELQAMHDAGKYPNILWG